MNLELMLKVIGWGMVATPIGIFLMISVYMVAGVANDDPTIMSAVMLGVLVFLLGAGILLLTYFTNIIPSLVG